MNKIQYFNIETSINDKRNIKGFELENKIKAILISDPDINISSCSIAVGAGYLHDEYPGTAHFLEHLLFMGNEKYPEQNDYHSYIQINGGYDNAFTADVMTCYYLALETSFLKKGIEMLSWFFRAPLLNEAHISSEMEIIDSEHNKNILSDSWIMDDIFKNFIKDNSKYRKFGTGNLKSLNKITKQDIVDFYNKYYTTDNLFVCIVDSKNINQMIDEYLLYFQAIPTKLIENNIERFKKDKLELVKNNLIIFNSSSDYLIVNYYIILDAEETNLTEYQLTHFINYLIGTEYKDSLGYYLKENDVVKNISTNIEYFYDYSANINVQFIMIDSNKDKITLTYYLMLEILGQIKNLSQDEFNKLYTNYRKIKTLRLLYDSTNDSVSISNEVVENMIKGNISEAIIRNNKVPEYDNHIHQKYIKILDNVKIKMTTNINFNNISKDQFINSKWYSSSYYMDNIKLDIKPNKIQSSLNAKFNFDNIIGIKNFIVKNNIINLAVDKNSIPELIFESNKLCRKVYLMEYNKYNRPIGSITIIRKNDILLDKYNKVIIGVYEEICNKILCYFLEVMSGYRLNFNISVYKEHLIYNFTGIEYELNFFTSQIIKQIHPDVLFLNPKSKKYFNEIVRDLKEHLQNFKYNPPYNICSKYISFLLDNNLLPEEKLKFLNKLEWNDFVVKIKECLKYTWEYYLLIGIKKYGYRIDFLPLDNYNFHLDQYINDIIDTLELNPNEYLMSTISNNNKINNINIGINKELFHSHNINSFDINPNEINNCLIRYWVCGDKINIIYNTNNKNIIDYEITKLIIKQKLIMSFVSDMLNEPLFDKIRTIDKIGYIVKVDNKIIYPSIDSIYFIIIFIIQSNYSIERISESIGNFCKFMIKDIKNNYNEYTEKFKLLKESKMIELKKPFSDLIEELSSYIESIITKNFIFNINPLYYEICSQINFTDDIEPIIFNIIETKSKSKSKYYDIVLNKKN